MIMEHKTTVCLFSTLGEFFYDLVLFAKFDVSEICSKKKFGQNFRKFITIFWIIPTHFVHTSFTAALRSGSGLRVIQRFSSEHRFGGKNIRWNGIKYLDIYFLTSRSSGYFSMMFMRIPSMYPLSCAFTSCWSFNALRIWKWKQYWRAAITEKLLYWPEINVWT